MGAEPVLPLGVPGMGDLGGSFLASEKAVSSQKDAWRLQETLQGLGWPGLGPQRERILEEWKQLFQRTTGKLICHFPKCPIF